MRSLLRGLIAGCVLLSAASWSRAGDYDDLLSRLPESANTVCIINVKTIRDISGSPPESAEIVAGAIVPPYVDVLVYATHLAPGELDSRKTGGVIRTNRDITLDDIADKTRGTVTDIGGTPVVSNPTRGYYAMLSPRLVGFARQVTRQEFARLFQFAKTNGKIALGKYLTESVAATDAPVVGVLDMEDLLDPKLVHDRLALSKAMEGRSKEEIEATAKLVAGIRGVTMAIRGRGLDEAEIRIDFSAPVGERAELVKRLFLEALDNAGAGLRDFQGAKAAADGNSVKLTVKLSDDGLNQIMVMFVPPLPSSKPAKEPKMEANGVSLQSTQKYFNSVNKIIDDARRKAKPYEDASRTGVSEYNRAAGYYDTAAKQIEQLPARYVDNDMVKYGEGQIAKLRTIALSLRGVYTDVNALQTGMAVVTTRSWGWWGGGRTMDSNVGAISQQQGEAIAKDANRRFEINNAMDSDRREVLRLINERYKTDLSKPIR